MSDSVQSHRRQPSRLPHPWDSPGKNTGVGCHFLLQCMKVKSESEVAQSCPTLRDPMDCSPPGSSIHGIFQARVLEWGALPSPVTPQVLVNPKLLSVCIDVPVLGISDKRNHTVGGLLCLAYLTCWAQGSPMLEQAAVLYSFLCVARSPL